jgi:hypothetical protein
MEIHLHLQAVCFHCTDFHKTDDRSNIFGHLCTHFFSNRMKMQKIRKNFIYMPFAVPIFSKLILTQQRFVKNCHVKLNENLSHTWSRRDGHCPFH